MPDRTDTVRLFVAIELAPLIQEQIARIQTQFRREPAARIVRWVQPEKMHLTLQFLGDTPVRLLPKIETSLREVCTAHVPFEVTFKQFGCFPNQHHPRVLWLGVQESSGSLQGLQRALLKAMAALGFATERRPYSPHLTLGRVKRHAGKEARRQAGILACSTDSPTIPPMPVPAVSLIRSQLCPDGPRYTTLLAALLGGQKGGDR